MVLQTDKQTAATKKSVVALRSFGNVPQNKSWVIMFTLLRLDYKNVTNALGSRDLLMIFSVQKDLSAGPSGRPV